MGQKILRLVKEKYRYFINLRSSQHLKLSSFLVCIKMVLRGSSQDLALERHCKIVSNFAPSQSKNRGKRIKCGVVLQWAIKLLLNLWVAFANSIV